MSKMLKDYVGNYIDEIDRNVYEINCNDFFTLSKINNSLRKMIVKEKHDFIDSGYKLSEDDLFLVRTMGELPDDLVYRSFANSGKFTMMKNPFERIMEDYNLSEQEIEDNKLVCPIFRDTVHFSINGIVSNLWYTDNFTDRGVVVIEPLKNHSDKLINVNPVDSFIDVGESDEPIKDNAVFIMDKNVYNNLSQEVKKKIRENKLYLFDSKKYSINDNSDEYMFNSPLEMITDMVICHNGNLPQHSISQSYLRSESCSYEGEHYSDKEYLKMFTDLIDKVSMNMFGISYYKLNEEIKSKRETDKDNYGVFHSDTDYFDKEISINYNNRLSTIKKYLQVLHDKLGLSDEMFEYIYKRYCRYVELNFSKGAYGGRGTHRLSLINRDDACDFIDKVSLDIFLMVTKEFNSYEKDLLDKQARKHQVSSIFNDDDSKEDEHLKKSVL